MEMIYFRDFRRRPVGRRNKTEAAVNGFDHVLTPGNDS
jgi:hypothetical protein